MTGILTLLVDRVVTPIGDLLVVADREGRLRATFWTDDDADLRRVLERHNPGMRIELESANDPVA